MQGKPHIMRMKYFGFEQAFEHIWNNADPSGIWVGDDATVAGEFGVTEDEAHEVLGDLCDRGLIEKLVPGKYAIVNWPERDEPDEEDEEL
jgi:predicted transcriptional regulator of viral defense system